MKGVGMANLITRASKAIGFKLKGLPIVRQSDVLTVLCYHRVGHLRDDQFHGFRPNFSATPDQFALQMKLFRSFFSPVSLEEVLLWRDKGKPLPPRAVLVTFDDGYRDNGEIAWPIMRDLSIPGIVFLATDHIGTAKPFLWDFAAYCYEATSHRHASVPLLGETSLFTKQERYAATSAWVSAVKQQPAQQRRGLMDALAVSLGVSPLSEVFSDLYLDWNEVRRLSREGLEFGGHTHTHPILTRLPAIEACEEIAHCQSRLTAEIGHPARAFAYPNGSAQDYSPEHEEQVRQAGFSIGFSLEPGPARLKELQERALAVRRLYVGMQDNVPRLLLKCAGGARFAEKWHNRGQYEFAGRERHIRMTKISVERSAR